MDRAILGLALCSLSVPAMGLIGGEEYLDEFVFIGDNSLKEWKAPANLSAEFPYYQSGIDEEGRPIWVAEFGKWDMRKIFEAGDEEIEKKLDRYINKLIFNVLSSLRENEGSPGEVVAIVDMEGYSLAQLTSAPTIGYITNKIAQVYTIADRRIGNAYIVNANYIAERFVNIIRPVLGGIMQRVEVFGANKSLWIPRLIRRVPKEELPEWYGGSPDFRPLKVFG